MFWTVAAILVTLASASDLIVGGVSDINDINAPEVQEALKFAVGDFNKKLGDVYQVAKVDKAQIQVVEGALYYFTVELARTNCRNGGVETDCKIYTDLTLAKSYTCTFEVWSRPWMAPFYQLFKNVCNQIS